MERLRGLGRYQIALLVCGVVMILVFSVLYPVTTARVGFLYQDTILTPAQEGDTTVYSGKLRGEAARFTVHADKSVEFQYGDKTYGPYTVTEDPGRAPGQRTEQVSDRRGGPLRGYDPVPRRRDGERGRDPAVS